jgi:hypothetical protein
MLQSCDSLVTILPRLQGFCGALHVILISSWFAAQKQHSDPGRIAKSQAVLKTKLRYRKKAREGPAFHAANRHLKNKSCPTPTTLQCAFSIISDCQRSKSRPSGFDSAQKRSASACLRSGGTLQLVRLVSPNNQTKSIRLRPLAEGAESTKRTTQPGYRTATHGWYCRCTVPPTERPRFPELASPSP